MVSKVSGAQMGHSPEPRNKLVLMSLEGDRKHFTLSGTLDPSCCFSISIDDSVLPFVGLHAVTVVGHAFGPPEVAGQLGLNHGHSALRRVAPFARIQTRWSLIRIKVRDVSHSLYPTSFSRRHL